MDFPETTDCPVTVDDMAAFDKVLVNLWVFEVSNNGPDDGYRCGDGLDHGGAALFRAVIGVGCGGVVDSLELKR
ncbi:hypothetical protein AgCh_035547 [Apium graveolens]